MEFMPGRYSLTLQSDGGQFQEEFETAGEVSAFLQGVKAALYVTGCCAEIVDKSDPAEQQEDDPLLPLT